MTSEVKAVQSSFTQYRTGCTRSRTFWKVHPDKWPVDELRLGAQTYNQEALLRILKQAIGFIGAIRLAHELIAAKLNIASGASAVSALLSSADTFIANRLPPFGNAFASRASSELN